MHGYITNIEQKSLENTTFRTVLFTSQHQQVVVMSIPMGGEIGKEVHNDSDQFIRIEAGESEATLNGETRKLSDGDIVVIPQGVEHNVVNTGDTDLKLYTIYSPPHHRDGTVHQTKAEADADEEHFDGKTSL